jgi:hypothetical protein
MERTKVESSNIASIGYDQASTTLEIEFQNGSVYQYFEVPLEIFQNFIQAGSKALFFSEKIKGYFSYVKI